MFEIFKKYHYGQKVYCNKIKDLKFLSVNEEKRWIKCFVDGQPGEINIYYFDEHGNPVNSDELLAAITKKPIDKTVVASNGVTTNWTITPIENNKPQISMEKENLKISDKPIF